jgi:hypothetical protein
MYNVEIPRQEWSLYFQGLSQRALGHRVRVEVIGPDIGDQPLAQALPLQEIELETKGSDKGAISLIVGAEGQEVTHRVLDVEAVFLEVRDHGDLACLELQERGGKTLVFFEPGVQARAQPGARRGDEASMNT